METLLGNASFRLKDFLKISDDWQTSIESGTNISIQKEWDITNPHKIDHIIYRYSGGYNGRILARYERTFTDCSKHIITLHDHKLNTLGECVVNETCRDIFIYVTSTDELRVVTSSGRLLIFQGETIVLNLPILSPELEPPPSNPNEQETQTSKRNREIIDVAFWETGFVYIDKDGFIVQYNIDSSNIQIYGQSTNGYGQTDTKTNDKYISNIESEYNMHTKVLSRDLKSIGIPICFDVIPPNYTGLSNGSPYVFVAGTTNELFIVSEGTLLPIKMSSSIISLSFSPSYKFVAVILDPMVLFIMPVNFDAILLRLEIDQGDVFEQLSWAGDDIPVISFDLMTILVLQNSETITIPTNSKSLIIKQSDSALILSDNALYRCSIISEPLARCFGIYQAKQKETSALKLIRAFCSYSHEQVLKMKEENELEQAIKDCIEGAQQLECEDQQLMQAASRSDSQTVLMMSACFGRSYLMAKVGKEASNTNADDPSSYVSSCFNIDTEMTEEFMKVTRWIRLAKMFKKELNIAVSPKCLRENTNHDDAIARICRRGLFSPAFEVADEFGGDKSLVVTRWCCKIIEKVKNDNLCYKFLIHMKKSLTNKTTKNTNSLSSPPSISVALNKMKKKNDDFGQNGENDDERFSCSLFDTASIASACLARGRTKLASDVANNELNSSLVIPFFAASGLWKEALVAAANTWDSNVLIEVLKEAVNSTHHSIISRAIEDNYFAYTSLTNLSLFWSMKRIEEDAKNIDKNNQNKNEIKKKMMEKRRKNRSRGVGQLDIEICNKITDNEYLAQSVKKIIRNCPKNNKVLDSYVKNKLRLLNIKVNSNDSTQNISKLVQNADDELKKVCIDFPTVKWVSNQSEIMTVETKLINLYQKFIKILEFENTNSNTNNFDSLKSLDIKSLSVNKLIRAAADSSCLSRLIELAKSESFDELSPKLAVTIAAGHLAKSGRFEEFKKLLSKSEAPFNSLYKLSTTIALHNFGKMKAEEFVNLLPDGKEKQYLLNLIGSASQVNSNQENPAFNLPFDFYGTNSISIDFFKSSKIGR